MDELCSMKKIPWLIFFKHLLLPIRNEIAENLITEANLPGQFWAKSSGEQYDQNPPLVDVAVSVSQIDSWQGKTGIGCSRKHANNSLHCSLMASYLYLRQLPHPIYTSYRHMYNILRSRGWITQLNYSFTESSAVWENSSTKIFCAR